MMGRLPPIRLFVALGWCFLLCDSFAVFSRHFRNRHRLRNDEPNALMAFSSSTERQGSSSSPPQLLEFIEPTTGTPVKLIGCMHYNPASIKLTTDTINELGLRDKLGSVVIESCDIRWNQTTNLPDFLQNVLQSEMRAGCDLAMDTYNRPVVLGDQRINITVASLKQGFQETVQDLATPWTGGWDRVYRNVTEARKESVPLGDSSALNAFAFFDPRLLLATPVTFILYPLSFLVKAPFRTLAALSLLFFVDQPTMFMDSAEIVTMDQMTVGDWVGSLAFSALEFTIFARIFLKELLAQRNVVLAENILKQCELYQAERNTEAKKPNFWTNAFGSFGQSNSRISDGDPEIIYVEGSEPGPARGPSSNQEGKAVAAVLGMAHCNGIMKLMKEQKV